MMLLNLSKLDGLHRIVLPPAFSAQLTTGSQCSCSALKHLRVCCRVYNRSQR